jgi:hypothetical protein
MSERWLRFAAAALVSHALRFIIAIFDMPWRFVITGMVSNEGLDFREAAWDPGLAVLA